MVQITYYFEFLVIKSISFIVLTIFSIEQNFKATRLLHFLS